MPTKSFAETAREEEDRVEAEEAAAQAADAAGEPAPEPEPEPPKPPEPEPATLTPKQIAARDKRIDTIVKTYIDKMRAEIGEDLGGNMPCPLCIPTGNPGLVVPFQGQEIDPEQRAAVLAVIGEGAGAQLKQDPDAVMCEACDGLGFRATGSRREGYTEQMCATCNGNGWHAKERPGQGASPAPTYPPAAPSFPGVTANGPGQAPQPYWDVASNSWKLP